MAKKVNVEAWLKSGEYLPAPLRDFHDQKEVFKAMHEMVREDPASFVKRPSWIEGQCYVIDVFLWFMARRGWTLQRTRRTGNFRDLDADVTAQTEHRNAAYMAALRDTRIKKA
jgi:hypothetical protein